MSIGGVITFFALWLIAVAGSVFFVRRWYVENFIRPTRGKLRDYERDVERYRADVKRIRKEYNTHAEEYRKWRIELEKLSEANISEPGGDGVVIGNCVIHTSKRAKDALDALFMTTGDYSHTSTCVFPWPPCENDVE